MKKPASLRTALTAALPELKRNPSRLALWVEDGAVRCRQTQSGGFALKYPLSVLISDCETDIAIVAFAITRWLQANQSDLLSAGTADSFSFEADILDNKTADIVFTLNLDEAVSVTPKTEAEGGGWSIEYQDEPDPLFAGDGEVAEGIGTPPIGGASADAIVAD